MARANRRRWRMRHKPLEISTVRVRWLRVNVSENTHLDRWRGMLNAEEVARADRFHFPADRAVFTAAHALVRSMLSEMTGQSISSWAFVNGAFGKPALAGVGAVYGLHFNISHTRELVA